MFISRLTWICLAAAALCLVGLAGAAEAQRISIGGGGDAPALVLKRALANKPALAARERIAPRVARGLKTKSGVAIEKDVTSAVTRKPPRVVDSGTNGKPVSTERPKRTPDRPSNQTDKPPRKPPVVVVRIPRLPPVRTPPVANRPKPPIVVDMPPIIRPRPEPPIVKRPIPTPPLALIPALPPILRAGPPALPPTTTPPPGLPPLAAGPPPSLQTLDTFVPDEVLTTVASTAPTTLEADVAAQFNVVILERTALPLIDARLVRMRIPDSRTVPAVVAAIGGDPRVSLSQPNFYYRPSSDPVATIQPAAVAGSGMQASLQYALASLNMQGAQRLAPGNGRGARVAVIDSGVDRTHPDFASAKIDEFDAFSDEPASQDDADRHGTGIAGIIAARGSVVGIAPAADVLSARVFRARGGKASNATTNTVLKGLTWSVENGARILNMSFAGPRDPLVERHVGAAVAKGVIPIAAAGNGGPDAKPAYPAAYQDVVAVTAIDATGKLYDKANRGGYVAIAAPGVDVIVPGAGQSHEFQSGTSYAAAHVSGIVALMLEVNPELTPALAIQLLERASDDLGTPGRDDQFGYGKVDAERAVQFAMESRSR